MAAAPLGWSGRHGSFFDKKKRNNTSACHEYCFLFIFIRNIFHNVLNSAIKNFTEIVQNERFHNHIFSKSMKLLFKGDWGRCPNKQFAENDRKGIL